MGPLDDLLGFLEDGIVALFHFVRVLLEWSLEQILSVPWRHLGYLPAWKIVVISVIGVLVVMILWRVLREFYEAGEKAAVAFVVLLSVFLRTLPAMLLAGVVAAAGAWVINNVQI